MSKKTNFTVNGNSYYRMTKTIGYKRNENGVEVPVRKQFIGKSKRDAEAKYEEFLKKRSQGLSTETLYFGIVAEDWIYKFFVNDTSIKDSTKKTYLSRWNQYVRDSELYSMPLDEISAATIQDLYNSLDAPVSAIKSVNKLMKRFYKYLVHEGYARDVTSTLIIPKRMKKIDDEAAEIETWADEEISTILNSFDKTDPRFRLRFLLVLAYNTGCRIGELLGLKYSDITDEGIRISKQVITRPIFIQGEKTEYKLDLDSPKSASSYRTIPINEDVKRELKRHMKWHKKDMSENGYFTEFVFTTDSGNFYDYRNILRACKRYYKKIGVEPRGFHTYRHTFGTNLCRNGIPIQTASELLGHEDINVTAKYYVRVTQEQKQIAINSLAGIMR